jgi:hypothetical protein
MYGNNLVPLNSFHQPLLFEHMMVSHHNQKASTKNVPIELGGKIVIIDIEVIDAPLDYNILFGCSYMYSMKEVASSIFCTMLFPHNGKIVTIDQLTHYEPNHSDNIDNVLPLIWSSVDISSVVDIGPRIFQDPSLLGSYQGDPPITPPIGSCTSMCCYLKWHQNSR